MPWPTILYTILLDWVMVITGLVGALVASSYKWGYFVFATVALFGIAYNVVYVGLSHTKHMGATINRTFLMCGVWTIFLWFLYPIAWGLSEGGNVIAPDSEAVFYGVLDIMAKPVFGLMLLIGHRNIDPRSLGLYIRDYQHLPDPNHPPHDHRGTASEEEKDAETAAAANNGGVFEGNNVNNATAANTAVNSGVIGTHSNHTAAGQTV